MEFNSLQSNFAFRSAKNDPQDRPIAKAELMQEIDWLERVAQRHRKSKLFKAAADLSRSYSVWFCHTSLGEDKRPPLERSLGLLKQASICEPNNPELELDIASALMGAPQVRDYPAAEALLGKLAQHAHLSIEAKQRIRVMQRTIELGKGIAVIPHDFDYGSSYMLSQERQVARTLCRQLKKTKDIDGMRPVLDHLYRLAVVASCEDYLRFKVKVDDRDRAMAAVRRQACKAVKFSYPINGRISPESLFLGVNDHKAFEFVWGATNQIFDPHSHFRLSVKAPFCQ
jgi:hypothetical protein